MDLRTGFNENWRQILTRDEYQIPDTTKEIIRDRCQIITWIYQLELFGLWDWYTEEEKQRIKKFYKDYEDLGQRVLNEAGKTDWNGVKERLEGISNEMREIKNGAQERRKVKAEHMRITADEDYLMRINAVQRRQSRINDDLFGKGMKINAETLEGEVVNVKNVTKFDLVRDVKDQIASRLGRKNPDEIILLHQQKEMKDTNSIGSYRITDGSTINVLPCVPGKGLFENARDVWDKAKNIMKRLVTWIPGLFADTTREVTKQELGKISHLIGNGWEILANDLGIDDVTLDHIKTDNKKMAMQIHEMLTTWMNDIGSEATVGKLYKTMEECSILRFKKEQIKLILSGAPPDL